ASLRECLSAIDGTGRRVLLVAVPDDFLAPIAERLAATLSSWSGWSVLHLSGASSRELLLPFAERGALTAVFHPCVPITEAYEVLPIVQEAVVTIEADGELGDYLTQQVSAWGGRAIVLSGIERASYHAGTALAAGHLLALLDGASGLLRASGLTYAESWEVVLSVSRGVLENVRGAREESSVQSALTGPYVRGDAKTIEGHLAALRAYDEQVASVYRLLGERITAMLQRGKPQGS
ncbi:MAG: DUF2520 domain-containing protein, partial [Bdellovibrionales bacterium]|nr:DUF2520 domain-containing protein [Bdellovibrionales bacterium]